MAKPARSEPVFDDVDGDDERDKLTNVTHDTSTDAGGGRDEPGEAYPNLTACVKPLAAMAWPVLLTYLCNFAVPVTSVIFVGHFGSELELAGIGLAVFFCNVTGYSVGINLQTAYDTLGSQAYGAKNFKRIGVLLQCTLLVELFLALPIVALWWNAESVLLALRQPSDAAALAAQYCRRLIVSLPFVFAFEALRRFCQVQGVVNPMLYVSIVADVLHPFWCWLYIYKLGLGFEGAAWATVTSHILTFTLMFLYLLVVKPFTFGTWAGWTCESLSIMRSYMKLAIPGALMGCLEWWSFEIVGMAAGSLGDLPLATHNILANTVPFMFMIPLGISVSASTMIGNLLGASDPHSAHKVSVCARIAIVTLASMYGVGFLLARNYVPHVFTNDVPVLRNTSQMYLLAAPFMFLDAFQAVGQGILRGCGLQTAGAILAFVGFYCVSLPSSFALAFKAHMGLKGLWTGMCIGYVFVALVYVVVIARINWQQSSEVAVARALGGVELVDEEKPNASAAAHVPTPKARASESRKSGMATSRSLSRAVELAPLTAGTTEEYDEDKITVSTAVAPVSSSAVIKPKTSFRYGLSTRLQEAVVDGETGLYNEDVDVEIDFSNDLLLADDEDEI